MDPEDRCRNCDASVPAGSSFCQSCGSRLGPEEPTESIALNRRRTAQQPLRLAAAEPRIFGIVPPRLALPLGTAAIVAGAVALAAGGVPLGIALIVLGIVLVALAIEAARRWPASDVARFLVRLLDGVASRLGFARVFAGTWAGAAREVILIRRELHALRSQLEADQLELGGAAYRQDDNLVTSLRARMGEAEQQIEERERRMTAVIEGAHDRIGRQRVAIQPTEPIAVGEIPSTDDQAVEPAEEKTIPHPSEGRSPVDR